MTRILGIELGSSTRAGWALNYWAIFFQPDLSALGFTSISNTNQILRQSLRTVMNLVRRCQHQSNEVPMKPNGLSYLGIGIKSNPWETAKVFQHLHLLVLALELDSTPGSYSHGSAKEKRKKEKILLMKWILWAWGLKSYFCGSYRTQ